MTEILVTALFSVFLFYIFNNSLAGQPIKNWTLNLIHKYSGNAGIEGWIAQKIAYMLSCCFCFTFWFVFSLVIFKGRSWICLVTAPVIAPIFYKLLLNAMTRLDNKINGS